MRFLTILIFLLCACAIQPHYPDHEYTDVVISSSQIPHGVRAYVDNNEVEILSHKDGVLKVRLPRTMEAKVLSLRRPGFKEIRVRLTPQKTNEKWAADGDKSAYWLTAPTNTMINAGAILLCVAITPFLFFRTITDYDSENENWIVFLPPVAAAGWTLALPFNIAQDAYNMTVGVTSVNLINPKYSYRIDRVEF